MTNKPKRRRKPRTKQTSGLPKGFYRVPGGGITRDPPPKELASGDRVLVRPIAHEQPNIKLLATALIDVAKQHDEDRNAGRCDEDCGLCLLTDKRS